MTALSLSARLNALRASEPRQMRDLLRLDKKGLAQVVIAGRISHAERDIADARADASIEALEKALRQVDESLLAMSEEGIIAPDSWNFVREALASSVLAESRGLEESA